MSNKVKLSSRCTVLFLVMLAIALGNLSRRHAAANASAQPTPPSNAPVPALVIVAGSHDHSATSGDGVPATSARIEPTSVTADGGGNLFIAESSANRVRRVAATNIITTIAGGGDDALGDGGPATNARLAAPSGVAVDRGGNLYIAEQGAHRIRRVTPEGIITTIAGTGASGFLGDGGPALSAHLTRPKLVALDRADGLYIVEADGRRVRKVTLGSGIITTVAGNGTSGFGGDGGPAVAAQFE